MPALAIASSQRNTLIIRRIRLLHLIKEEEAKEREKEKKKKKNKKHKNLIYRYLVNNHN